MKAGTLRCAPAGTLPGQNHPGPRSSTCWQFLEELQQSGTDEVELTNYVSHPQVVPHKQIWKIADMNTVDTNYGEKKGLSIFYFFF